MLLSIYLYTGYPYDSGTTRLDTVPGIPVAFCKYVDLNRIMFDEDLQMHIQLTVTWNQSKPSNISHDATASWSEEVSINGFKACVMVAGRHFFGIADKPGVHWIAYQVRLRNAARGALEGGVVTLKNWYTGSKCAFIMVKVSATTLNCF